jgi:hypothetical protein
VAAKYELHLVRDWNAAWTALVRPWLAAPAALRRDYVVVPTRGQAHALKLRCVREGMPLLGVEFLTPGLARQKWTALAPPPRPALGRELLMFNLHMLLEERLVRMEPGGVAAGLDRSLLSDLERALDDFDELLQAGRSAADFSLSVPRELFGELERRVGRLGYDFVARQDRVAAAAKGPRAPLGGRLLIYGFSSEHARNFHSLVALARHTAAVRVVLPQPEFGARSDDERWIEAWERTLAVDAQSVDAPEPVGPGPAAASLWLEGSRPDRPAGVLVGQTRADEMLLVADEIVRRLADGATNLAVVFPGTGATHLRLVRLLQQRQIPFNDLLEAVAPPPIDLQLRRAVLQFYERGARIEELLALWPLLRALSFTDLSPGDARDTCERVFQRRQSHSLAAVLPDLVARRTRPEWQEVARVAALLLPAWPERLSLRAAIARMDAICARFRLPELETWTALLAYASQDEREQPLALAAATLAAFLPDKVAATGTPGRGLFASVTLTSWRRAYGLGWSDVIFVESNAGVWPKRVEASCWLTDDHREALNRRSDDVSTLPTSDSRALAERHGLAAIARNTTGSVVFSAALFDEQEPELKLAPNGWLERVLLSSGEAADQEERFSRLARAVAVPVASETVPAGWLEIWRRRRDPAAPFDEYFCCGDPAVARPSALTPRLIEAGYRDPAVLWFEGVLGVKRVPWSPFLRARKLALGSLAHEVLARVLRGTPADGVFAELPRREDALDALARELTGQRRRWPDDRYWDSFHAELAELTRRLLEQVYQLPSHRFVGTEVKLPAGTLLALGADDIAVGVSGRMDLVLSDRPEWGGAQVEIVDFKTGADAKLSAAAMAGGASLQLGIYLAAVGTLGVAGGRVWMLKSDPAKSAHLPMEELPAALSGLAQIAAHLRSGRYGARTVDRTEFSHGYEWPVACAPIPQAMLEKKFAVTFGTAPATGGPDE